MTQSTEKYTVFLTTQNLMNRFTVRQTHTHRDIMDDSDTELYKWWDNVDRKETFKDILKRVWKGGDFASDEERIVEAFFVLPCFQVLNHTLFDMPFVLHQFVSFF